MTGAQVRGVANEKKVSPSSKREPLCSLYAPYSTPEHP